MAWDWGAIATAALEGYSAMSQGSAARQGSKDNWAAQLEQTRLGIAGQRELLAQTRQYQLDDRAFNRAQIDNYRQFYSGTPSKPVDPINTTPSTRAVPADLQTASERPAPPPKKKKKKGFLSRLFG